MRAQALPPTVTVRTTPPTLQPALVSHLAAELRLDGVREVLADADTSCVARITFTATSATRFEITVDDLATGKEVMRPVDVAAVDESLRTRALAIAAAELLRASWLELATRPEPTILSVPDELVAHVRAHLTDRLQPQATLPESAPREPEPSRSELSGRAATLNVAGATRGYLSSGLWLFGARVGVHIPIEFEWLVFRGDIGWLGGSVRSQLGAVDLWQLSFAIGISLSAEIGPVRLFAGPRLESGLGWAAGRPDEPTTASGQGGDLVVLGEFDAGASVHIVDWFRVGGRVAAGWTFSGLEALVDGLAITGLVEGAFGATLFVAADL